MQSDNVKAEWLREVEMLTVRMKPALAGRMDWDTAIFLFNQGTVSTGEAATILARVKAGKEGV